MKQKRDYKREKWMDIYARKAEEINPKSAGRIDWDTAYNAYSRGKLAEEAAILIFGMGRGIKL